MICVLNGSHSFTCTPRVHPLTDAFAFPAEAGTHLPTPEGFKDELALGGWLVTYRNKTSVRHRELNSDIRSPISELTSPDVD